ncbi:hypothetical protein F4777DRAFT_586427 [Nemania sp. FL0916]|nr:hypothetical protein F4777DRAFT_586427 [Nemania sp. FL0916]
MATIRASNPILRASSSSIWRAGSSYAPRIAGSSPRFVRAMSSGPYGYYQVEGLAFQEYGEPKDVLKMMRHSISPGLPPSSVVLRTLAAPINPADVNTIQGTYGAKPVFSSLFGTPKPAALPGNEGVFEVVSDPPRGSGLTKGDWVIPARTGFGTWRTYAVAPADSVLRIANRDLLDPRDVAAVAVNPCSAYRMLRDYATPPLREGDWFIQNGANSAVGRAAIQLGSLWGYRSINVIRARPEGPAATQAMVKELKDLGADYVITEDELKARDFGERVREWTEPGGGSVRLGLNCVGGQSALTLAKTLSVGATLVTYGGMSRQPVTPPTGLLIFKDIHFAGFWLSRWADADPAGAKKQTIDEILDLIRRGRFRQSPMEDIPWTAQTSEHELKMAVQQTLEGYKNKKRIFVFNE